MKAQRTPCCCQLKHVQQEGEGEGVKRMAGWFQKQGRQGSREEEGEEGWVR